MWWGVLRRRGLGKKDMEVRSDEERLIVGGMGDAEEGHVRAQRGAGVNGVSCL